MHFSPDGSNLITSSDDDQVLLFWEQRQVTFFLTLFFVRLLCTIAKEGSPDAPSTPKSTVSIWYTIHTINIMLSTPPPKKMILYGISTSRETNTSAILGEEHVKKSLETKVCKILLHALEATQNVSSLWARLQLTTLFSPAHSIKLSGCGT